MNFLSYQNRSSVLIDRLYSPINHFEWTRICLVYISSSITSEGAAYIVYHRIVKQFRIVKSNLCFVVQWSAVAHCLCFIHFWLFEDFWRHSWQPHSRRCSNSRESSHICQELRNYNTRCALTHEEIPWGALSSLHCISWPRKDIWPSATRTHLVCSATTPSTRRTQVLG